MFGSLQVKGKWYWGHGGAPKGKRGRSLKRQELGSWGDLSGRSPGHCSGTSWLQAFFFCPLVTRLQSPSVKRGTIARMMDRCSLFILPRFKVPSSIVEARMLKTLFCSLLKPVFQQIIITQPVTYTCVPGKAEVRWSPYLCCFCHFYSREGISRGLIFCNSPGRGPNIQAQLIKCWEAWSLCTVGAIPAGVMALEPTILAVASILAGHS